MWRASDAEVREALGSGRALTAACEAIVARYYGRSQTWNGCIALPRHPARQKPKLIEFHIMRIRATPARLVGVVRATDEQTALAEVIARHRIPPHMQRRLIVLRAAWGPSSMPRKPGRRYIRAVLGSKDRRFPKRDPEIEAMYPGHLLPSSPQMLEELLRRSLELEQSVIREPLIVVRAA
jgi:hypothetical protein